MTSFGSMDLMTIVFYDETFVFFMLVPTIDPCFHHACPAFTVYVFSFYQAFEKDRII